MDHFSHLFELYCCLGRLKISGKEAEDSQFYEKKLCHNYFPCLHLFGSEIWDRARRERGQREREKWCEAETSYLTDPARRQKRRSEKGFKNFPASDCGCSQMLPKDISKNSLVLEFGVPP